MKETTKKKLKIGAIVGSVLGSIGISIAIYKHKEAVSEFFDTDLSNDNTEISKNTRLDVVKDTMNAVEKDLEKGYKVAYVLEDHKFIEFNLHDSEPNWVGDGTEHVMYF